MKSILEIQEEEKNSFIIMDEFCRVFNGLKGGYPTFSSDYDSARKLYHHEQFKKVQYGTKYKLEKFYI